MIADMQKIEKIEVYDSSTNFVLFKIKEGSASHVFDELLKKKKKLFLKYVIMYLRNI